MQVKLSYGRHGLTVDLPETVDVVAARFVPGLPDEQAAIREAMHNPVQSAPLADLVKPGDRVVIVHTDITRATPNNRLLPVLLEELERAGVHRQDILLLNGLGTHRPQSEAELRAMLGDFIVEHYECIQHDCNDDANIISLGQTSLGHPVRINRFYLESDVRILTGFIEPHFFAGFSGGPKAILPSLAGAVSVFTNHGLEMIAHKKATWGVLEENPNQSVKGLSTASQIVRQGGTIIIATACEDGLPDHGRYAALLAEAGSPQGILKIISRPGCSEQDQWQVQIQAQIQLQTDVFVYSEGLTDQQIEAALFSPCRDIEQTLAQLRSKYGSRPRICVIPESPLTIPTLRNRSNHH